MGRERFLNMTFEELDREIDKLPNSWMKALMYQVIKDTRNDYEYKTKRKELKNDRESKSITSR